MDKNSGSSASSGNPVASRRANSPGLTGLLRTYFPWFLAGALVGAVVIVLGSLGLAAALPEQYVSKVRLEISRVQSDSVGESVPQPTDPETQAAIITSEQALFDVVDSLVLVQRWKDVNTRSEAYEKLATMIDVTPVPDTSLLDIEVYGEDPEEAAQIANSVAESVRKYAAGETKRYFAEASDLTTMQNPVPPQQVSDVPSEMRALGQPDELGEDDSPSEPTVGGTQSGSEHLTPRTEQPGRLQARANRSLTMPQNDRVTIHELAKPQEEPVTRNRSMVAGIGVGLALLLAVPIGIVTAYVRRAVAK